MNRKAKDDLRVNLLKKKAHAVKEPAPEPNTIRQKVNEVILRMVSRLFVL